MSLYYSIKSTAIKKQAIIIFTVCLSITSLSCRKSAAIDSNPSAGMIDNALVSHWKQSYTSTIEIETGPGGNHSIPSGEYVDFILLANGTYTQTYFNQSSSGCTIIVLGTKKGHWHVDGKGTAYFDETYYHVKATDDCNPFYNMDKDLALRHIKYDYTIASSQNGKPELHLQTTNGDDVFYQ